ncbi:C-X-C motif chemokine 9 [Vombatus ursinus]|uniref:C-X-C motif chemokine n=1 Tax=Vombatus ursinus TaxID=29139 RepID=A0A4X2KSD9_VOMUR|nr:C-X-C motif chemokine 9 [Vombatus ursinus]
MKEEAFLDKYQAQEKLFSFEVPLVRNIVTNMKSGHLVFLWGIIFLTLTGVQAFLVSKTGRCSCINVGETKIQKKAIQKLEEFYPGPSCSHTEIIATMKNGEKKCLDPDSPHMKILVKMWKKMENKKKKLRTGNKKQQTKKAKKIKKAQHPPPGKTA